MVSRCRQTECAPAQCNLACAINRARRGAKPEKAVKWFIRAARKGDKRAAQSWLHYASFKAAKPKNARSEHRNRISVNSAREFREFLFHARCQQFAGQIPPSPATSFCPPTNNAAAALSKTASRLDHVHRRQNAADNFALVWRSRRPNPPALPLQRKCFRHTC